ncbi:LysR substrate-binding domain-containing protein [Acetobacter ascendens]|uniref:LysR family transcriptional regulator n=1 Tax=Acetobacter ascendens TaxID=481146 RepID=A0A1D8QWW1_9PROT|nr:LysR substrate-binding domain-containing protein [Acetobacter ascendens]AOW46828.1 LysR family transcriptional regulator [Acetobacter ascendens]AOW49151.1 LysR family transcriptional regulator [Acetobacter ascendens]
MDIRRLQAFVKIIDIGSISRAADILNIAQPALSQQLASLETAFKQKLLIRSKMGVTPTAAGLELYRHAQTMIKQLDRAMTEVSSGGGPLVGKVSVGLSPYSSGSTLSLALLKEVRAKLPGIILHLTESFDDIYSGMVMTGRLDMAIIHGAGPIKGVNFTPLMKENFFLVAPEDSVFAGRGSAPVKLSELTEVPLLLPPDYNFVRKHINTAFARKQIKPHIVAEVEALLTLQDAVAAGIGFTILPWSVASKIIVPGKSRVYELCSPVIQEDVSLCVPESIPETEAGVAVRNILIALAKSMVMSQNWPGTQIMDA